MRKMWGVYSLAWIVYAILIAFVVQFDEFHQGTFNYGAAFRTVLTTLPQTFILALIWPLSAVLVKAQVSTTRLVSIHFGSAFAFATFGIFSA